MTSVDTFEAMSCKRNNLYRNKSVIYTANTGNSSYQTTINASHLKKTNVEHKKLSE